MQHWWLTGEATLEELLSDDMMGPVVASAGMNREQLRLSLADVARRLGRIRSHGSLCRKELGQIAVGF